MEETKVLWEVGLEGNDYRVTNEPIANRFITDGKARYRAWGLDRNDNLVIIYWDTTAEWDEKVANEVEGLDESEACDWDNPVAVMVY